MAALGLIPALYPFGTLVPITAQSLGVMLAGAILGPRRGALAVLVLLLLVAVGLPLLSGGRGGLGVFFTPTVGYLVGWPVAAFVVGWLTVKGGAPYRLGWGITANVVGGIVVMYALGIAGTALVGQISVTAAALGALVFVPGDVLKAVVAALVARGVHASYPGLIARRAKSPAETSAV